MTRRGFRGRVLRMLTLLALGGSAIQLHGCNPTVRDSLLVGLETTANALADTLVQTFFAALQNNSSSGGLTTTTP